MLNPRETCSLIPTNVNTRWPHHQYYIGEKDQEHRRNGHGQNHWTGAESIEWYTGRFIRDTMHGTGDYRWRYHGHEGTFATYEGHFYENRMHGYGTTSYPDGRTFNGIYYKNIRWGPGVESYACLRADVGLWRGTQLVRLTWRPATPNVALDLSFGSNGKACVEPHRTLLTTRVKTIGEVNNARELMKQFGADPITASEKWTKLYPKNCTDLESHLCHVEIYDLEYYKNKIYCLEDIAKMPQHKEEASLNSDDEIPNSGTYFAWNNSDTAIHMMKHCFQHEKQRSRTGLDLLSILSGQRNQFKRAGQHELDCRILLMASYLGHITHVAQLVNESYVHPDVADIQGNTALMYASCGDQADIIHFLVEAGANINNFNDSCCTPLCLALIRFACTRKDIVASGMVQALVPPPVIPPLPPSAEDKPSEWHITRDLPVQSPVGGPIIRTPSKTAGKLVNSKKGKTSVDDIRRKTEIIAPKTTEVVYEDVDDTFSEEKRLYTNINTEFSIKVVDLFSHTIAISPVPYIFEVNDMVKEIDASEEELKKPPDKNPKKVASKVIKDTMKPSKEIMWQASDKEELSSISSVDRAKIDTLNRMMVTILQLLTDGADPRLVRCPQPALFIAAVSGCPDLVRHLVNNGANVNEVYSETHNYTPLDVAVSQPLTYDNLDIVRAFLECGAITDHRLQYGDPETRDPLAPDLPGPTLLHAVLAKKTENETEEEIRRQLLELLLEYNCNSLTQFKGHSSIDVAMTKSMDIFDSFIKCPRTHLNAVINDSNQTIIVKMFTLPFCKTIPIMERLQTLTNLLLFGADPLLECRNGEDIYRNIFVYAKKVFSGLESTQNKPSSPIGQTKGGKDANKAKKDLKLKKDEKLSSKSLGKLATDDVGDYKQAMDLVTECARILHVRWLQAKLLKELIEIVTKYQHRQWNMILPQHKNKKPCGLWLTCTRSLEIWDILKTNKRKSFNDRRILKHVLCMVQFYCQRSSFGFKRPVTAEEKGCVESFVGRAIQEHKRAEGLVFEQIPWGRPYVMPELAVNAEQKFQVCFECSLPFDEPDIRCTSCKQVSFCSFECIKANIDRVGCHPCRDYLKNKYYPSPDESASASY